MQSKIARFLEEAFPSVARDPAPDCWVSKAMRSGRPEFSILSSAIDAVERHGQLGRLNDKVKLQHPSDKPHQSQYDARVRDALTEACAFAWADLRGLGPPIFSDAEGAPDVQLDTGFWVEAKAIHSSDEDAERIEEMLEGREAAGGNVRPTGPGLFNKLDSAFDDAAKKFSRVDSCGDNGAAVWQPRRNVVNF